MGEKKNSGISRREFARRAVMASAGASLAPVEVLTADSAAPSSEPQESVMVTKRIFKFLAGDSVIKLTTYNGPTKYGYLFNASYNVFANPGGKQVTNGSGVSTSENVTQVSSNVPITPTTGAGALTANSQVLDTLSLTNNSPLPANLSIVDSQTWAVGSIYVRTNTVTWSASGVSITNQGPYN